MKKYWLAICFLLGALTMSLLEPQMKGSPYQNEIALDDFSGWHTLSPELWVYFSADAPSFVVEIDSTSDIFTPGMRVRLKQDSGVYKYFGVNKVEITTKTYLTLYGGTSYTLANETITEVAVSNAKAPYGFPLDPSYWSIEVTESSWVVVNTPNQDQIYDSGISIDIPVGLWNFEYVAAGYAVKTSDYADVTIVLSESNLFSSNFLAAYMLGYNAILSTVKRDSVYSYTSPTTLYFGFYTTNLSLNHIWMKVLDVRAVWAYL